MELVHGLTVREHLSGRAMPIRSALDIAVQLTSALAAAHVLGIVHRDLKPENVMVTPEGLVKVLDFGIAKRQFPRVVSDDDAGAPTIRTGGTEGSTIVGTVGYMSPEQAVGLPAGPASESVLPRRNPVPSVTGRRAFHRDSQSRDGSGDRRGGARACPSPHQNRASQPSGTQSSGAWPRIPPIASSTLGDLDRALRQIRDGLSVGVTRREWLSLGAAGVLALTGVTTWALWPFPSLAVLPFVNTAKDDAVDYLCLGLTESLIGRIKHLPLAVKSLSLVSNFVGILGRSARDRTSRSASRRSWPAR